MAAVALVPLRCISSMATRQVLAALFAAFASRTGRAVELEAVGGVDAARRIQAGEAFDVAILAADAIDKLVGGGHLDAGSRVDLARSPMAIAVRAGARRPAIGSAADVRQAVIDAHNVGFSTGPSGVHLQRLIDDWGIAAQLEGRVVQAKPGVPVGSLVASGDVELGFQQLSELLHVEGIDVLGTLPADMAFITTFSAARCRASQADGADALLDFMTSADAAAVKRAHGMEPA